MRQTREIEAEGSERTGRIEQEAKGARDRNEQRMGNTKTASLQPPSELLHCL